LKNVTAICEIGNMPLGKHRYKYHDICAGIFPNPRKFDGMVPIS